MGPCDSVEKGKASACRRPNLDLCMALVDAWKYDAPLSRISADLFNMEAAGRHVFFNSRARAWLAKVNPLASDALWDGFPNRAVNLMRRHGFQDTLRVDKPAFGEDRKCLAKNRLEWVGAMDWRERNARRAWKTCK
jgi:hypothetical protein